MAAWRSRQRGWSGPDFGGSSRSATSHLPAALRATSILSHLEPGPDPAVAAQDLRFDQPLAAIVSDERDARCPLWRREDRVQPIGLPAIIERVEEPGRMTMEM